MAKKSPSNKRATAAQKAKRAQRPASWYTDLPNADQRESALRYIATTTKLARQFFKGFDAKDGYDLRHPERMSWQRFNTLKKYGQQAHTLTSSPYYRAVARTKKEHDALRRYTGQAVKSKTHGNRAYVVHHPEAAYRDIKIKVNKKGRVTLVRKLPGVTTRSQIFMFIEYGFNPKTFVSVDDVKRAVKTMIKSGDLPEVGHYQLESELHGAIWYTMDRDDILLNLDSTIRDSSARSPSFSKGLLGLRYYTDDIDAELLDAEKTRRLAERKKARAKFRHVNEGRTMFGRWSEKYYDQSLTKKKKAKKKPKKKARAKK